MWVAVCSVALRAIEYSLRCAAQRRRSEIRTLWCAPGSALSITTCGEELRASTSPRGSPAIPNRFCYLGPQSSRVT